MEDREFFGIEVNTGESVFFKVSEILFVDKFSPKKNYEVPRFHTRSGVYTVPLTLDACRNGLSDLVPLDNKNLVNLSEIDHLEVSKHQTLACFSGTELKVPISKNKRKYLKGIPTIKVPDLW